MKIAKLNILKSRFTKPYTLAYSGQFWLWVLTCLVALFVESGYVLAIFPQVKVVDKQTINQSYH
ncbi:MAG: hypothetical protein HC908_05255 [Calothrix sp. SM1_7_51]|nr:hypothetical protein [Calothrix sp. SM1_7_51]